MVYREPVNTVVVNSYQHSLWMRLKRRWQKLFLRNLKDRQFAARFHREMLRAVGKPAWIIAERATKTTNNTDLYVKYGLLEDTPWLSLRALWVLRSLKRKYWALNKK